MKIRREEDVREQLTLDQQLNQTARRITESGKRASYTKARSVVNEDVRGYSKRSIKPRLSDVTSPGRQFATLP